MVSKRVGTRLAVVSAALGGGLVYGGFSEQRLASVAKPTPQTMTLAELIENGPGDNAHLQLEDVLLCSWSYVYEAEKGRWQRVWVPAVPLGGEYDSMLAELPEDAPIPPPDDVRVIFKLVGARDDEEVARIAAQDVYQGMVVNEIDSLDDEERDLLAESYPGVDFDSCVIFQLGRAPAGAGRLAVLFGGGGLLLTGGLAGLVLVGRKPREEPGRRRARGRREEDPGAGDGDEAS